MEKRAVDVLLSNIQNAEFILAKLGVVEASSVIYGYDGDKSVKVTITFRNGVYLPDEDNKVARYTIKNNQITYLFEDTITMMPVKLAMYPLFKLMTDEILDSFIM